MALGRGPFQQGWKLELVMPHLSENYKEGQMKLYTGEAQRG